MVGLRNGAWFFLVGLLACGVAGQPAEVHLDGNKKVPASEVIDDKTVIPNGTFTVGFKNKDDEAALLADMEAAFDTTEWEFKGYMSLAMFTADLTNEMIKWLLQRSEVTFIEQDGTVTTAEGDDGGGSEGGGGGIMLMGGSVDETKGDDQGDDQPVVFGAAGATTTEEGNGADETSTEVGDDGTEAGDDGGSTTDDGGSGGSGGSGGGSGEDHDHDEQNKTGATLDVAAASNQCWFFSLFVALVAHPLVSALH